MPWIFIFLVGALILYLIFKRERKVINNRSTTSMSFPPLEYQTANTAEGEEQLPVANFQFELFPESQSQGSKPGIIDFEEVFFSSSEGEENQVVIKNEMGEKLGLVPEELSSQLLKYIHSRHRLSNFVVVNRQAGKEVVKIYIEVYEN